MTDKEKLSALINHFANGHQGKFADMLGVSRANVATWMFRNSITANGREAILDAFPQVNREWLTSGSTIRSEIRSSAPNVQMIDADNIIRFSHQELIPYFETSRASCGIVEQLNNQENISGYIQIPGSQAMAALKAEGVSMQPIIHDQDICLIGRPIPLSFVKQNNIYMIVTKSNMCMFKRITFDPNQPESIVLISENPAYEPHEQILETSAILYIYPIEHIIHRQQG